MVDQQTVVLPGGESTRWLDERALEAVPAIPAPVELTLVLRRQAELPESLIEGPGVITREELGHRYGADPGDLALVEHVLGRLGLKVDRADAASRLVTVAGPLSVITDVFGAAVTLFESEDPFGEAPAQYWRHCGQLRLPAELDGVVLSVFGLDTQPCARPEFRTLSGQPRIVYTPIELGRLYDFPAGTDGTGQTLAIISLGGGYRRQDLEAYFADLGVQEPQIDNVSVDGADVNAEVTTPSKFDLEVTLDLQIAGALAPGAHIVNYFTHNTGPGLVRALEAAIHAPTTPTVLSLSWGSPEETYSGQLGNAMNELFADAAALGITVCAASGDAGSGCGVHDGGSHVNFPASSPFVLACGGTTLIADPASNTIHSETTWNSGSASATGGGVSGVFDLPDWQAGAGVPNRFGKDEKGRGLPDVAANADSMTGYQILLNGNPGCIGGTSAATPLWAALICRLVQSLGRPIGLLQPLIYHGQEPGKVTAGFRDVVAGDNGAYGARPGWDPNTGLGSPDGTTLLAALRERMTVGSG